MEKYRKYEPIFGSWYLNRLLGKGSFGSVYEIIREEFGTTYRSALKIITVPQDDDDIKTRMSEGTDIDTISEYYEGILREIVNENEIMSKLKGNSNIVSYEDHQIIPHDDRVGYDILIRMELLTPLLDRMMEKQLDEKEVVTLGIDICKALELCHRKNIIHRDIKPQNIFISENGDYKLGDFGIARTMEKTTGGMSKKGTYKYMAPEVFRGEDYDSTVDIYSLGIVLYSLLNGNRGPFLPAPPAKVTHNDEEEARMRRFRGEAIPAPRDAGPMLGYIIQKACAADPARRYRTAEQMRRDLESYLENYGNLSEQTFDEPGEERTELDSGIKGYAQVRDIPKVKGNKLKVVLAVTGLILLACIGILTKVSIGNSAKTIDLADLMKAPVVRGYDGYGYISETPVINEEKKQELLQRIKDDGEKTKIGELLDSVSYDIETTDRLSNGDYIEISAAFDTMLADEIDMEIKGEESRIKVDELSDVPDYLEGADYYKGHFYKLVDDPMYWTAARDTCAEQNGHLVTIMDQEEQAFINEIVEEKGTLYHYWLGATDEDYEGDWRWVTGERVPLPGESGFQNWCGNQPNNITAFEDVGQDYLELQKTRGDQGPEEYLTWTDIGNSGLAAEKFYGPPDYNETKYYGYICEWDVGD